MIAYTDGSYKKNRNGDYGVGWSYVLLDDDTIAYEDYGSYNAYKEQRNVSGEIYAVVQLVLYCEEHGIKELEIHHDYVGISAWVLGNWKCKQELTRHYKEFMDDSPLDITFVHVDGHSGDKWNDYVDGLAKLGVEMEGE